MAKFARIDITPLVRKLKDAERIVEEESSNMAEEVGLLGQTDMKVNILASGTPFSNKARQVGLNKGPGRFRTGEMYNSVEYRVEGGGTNVRAVFGWIRNYKKYFTYQEEGFKNRFLADYTSGGRLILRNGRPSVRVNSYGGHKNTKGMFALRDARKYVQEQLPRLRKKYNQRITRRASRGQRSIT